MNRLLIFFLLSLFVLGCISSSTKNTTGDMDNNTTGLYVTDTLPKMGKVSHSSRRLDSIDKANAAMIGTDESDFQKAIVSGEDSTIWLSANMKRDHRIFGYEKADTSSKRLLLISIFTADVLGNPFRCPLGAYYETPGRDEMELKYMATTGNYIKVNVTQKRSPQGVVYMERKWIEFVK